MTWAHLHLALNHVPVIGILLVIVLLAAAVLRGSRDLLRASYGLIILVAVIGLAVYLTGEPAEKLVEHLPGYPEGIVERHEEAALLATIGMSILGVLAALGLAPRARPWYPKAMLLLGLLVAALMGWTANLGGQIRHPEIRAVGQ
jgi:uncharacterized membrane protein